MSAPSALPNPPPPRPEPAPVVELSAGASVRRAALLLHALPEADRGWLLGQLPGPDRAGLGALLEELSDLGIAADRALLDEVLGGRSPYRATAPEAGAPPAPGPVGDLRRVAPHRMAALLRNEPPGLVGAALALHDWPWRAQVLTALGPVRARQAEELAARWERSGLAAEGGSAPALAAELLAALQRRLSGGSAVPAAPGAAPRAGAGTALASRLSCTVRRWLGRGAAP
jgi:hypothetical protein